MDDKKKRNRSNTRQHILGGLQAVIAERGLAGVSISHVALKANVSKVLIYRYFTDIEGLLQAYIEEGRLFPNLTASFLDQLAPLHGWDVAKVWTLQTLHLFRHWRSSKAARELLRAGLLGAAEPRAPLSQAQDEGLDQFAQQLPNTSAMAGGDSMATLAILLGGLSYLTLLAHSNRPILGINLRSEVGWQRIEDALKVVYQALDDSSNTSSTMAKQIGHLTLQEW